MPVSDRVQEILRNLARRPANHDAVKADFRALLREEFGVAISEVEFERGDRTIMGRLDALVGRTVFEAKRDLTREMPDVLRRMPDYLASRERENGGERFVGIASDGKLWVVFERAGPDGVAEIKRTILDPDRPEPFLSWLDGVLALKAELPPNALTIRDELGGDSIAYLSASRSLAELWARLKSDPAIALKRQLWAQLLKLVKGKDSETDALWFQHTFLVIVAKAIAFAVLDLKEDDPARLLSCEAFRAAGVKGAVESDFFDWVVADPEGDALVRRLMAHVRRFRLAEVETDILKVLYESLIDREERHGLGEYYTPDWLARKVVRHAVERPLEQRVLDPACGSGAFLFHAVRYVLDEAEAGGMAPEERARECAALVAGLDIHPVAVIIARVTYLLALAPALARRSAELSIPVFLGDSMQLSVEQTMTEQHLTIRVPAAPDGSGATSLIFPALLCSLADMFDALVEHMRSYSEAGRPRARFEAEAERLVRIFYADRKHREHGANWDYTDKEAAAVRDLGATYETYDALRRAGRDTIWSYVARNLARPLAYAFGGGSAQVLVGNPPWVAFRHMSRDLQVRFKELAQASGVYVGGKLATQNDLSALFTTRSVQLYLRAGGRLAFVMPLAALSRGQFERLRSGSLQGVKIAWDEAWTMDDGVAPLFPVPSCVIFGRKRRVSHSTPDAVRAYTGTLPFRDAPEKIADARLKIIENAPKPREATFEGGSAYRKAFRQGATLVPRMLCLVEKRKLGRLGSNSAAPAVQSRRSSLEKEPWRSRPGIDGTVEAEFLREVLLGESILPYRINESFEGVIPVTEQGEMLDADAAAARSRPALAGWMRQAQEVWDQDLNSAMSLVQRWNFHNELGAQFPLRHTRVAYAKAGTQPAAIVLRGSTAVLDHKLYWAAPASEDEASYLVAILNSETARARTEGLQSRGQFGARDFDKVIWSLPIPRFSAADPLHRDLAAAASEAEEVAGRVELPESVKFQRARKLVREALTDAGVAPRIDALVARLLGGSA